MTANRTLEESIRFAMITREQIKKMKPTKSLFYLRVFLIGITSSTAHQIIILLTNPEGQFKGVHQYPIYYIGIIMSIVIIPMLINDVKKVRHFEYRFSRDLYWFFKGESQNNFKFLQQILSKYIDLSSTPNLDEKIIATGLTNPNRISQISDFKFDFTQHVVVPYHFEFGRLEPNADIFYIKIWPARSHPIGCVVVFCDNIVQRILSELDLSSNQISYKKLKELTLS